MSTYFLCVFFISAITITNAAKIIAVYPAPSISHQVVFRVLTRELVKRGHEVVVITPNPEFSKDQAPVNLTEIDVHDISYSFYRELLLNDGNQFKIGSKSDGILQASTLQNLLNVVERQIKSEQVTELIKTNNGFDLLLIEACARQALVFSHIFKAPVIQISSFGTALENLQTFGTPTHPILYPTVFRQRLHNLSIWEKIQELFFDIRIMYSSYKNLVEENKMVQRILSQDGPSINELVKNVEMLFLNVHPMWVNNMPVPPNVIFMGGLHQKRKTELPQDLKTFLDSSRNGVVYVSFGTNVHPTMFPSERLKVLTQALSELPYDILFKWNDDELLGKTENIKISKWLPQSDLLRHPNIKAFVTQGGLQSTDEAITAGVPLVCFPMFGDQWYNAEQYEHFRIGIQLDLSTFTKLQLKNAIDAVISNTSYRENILKLREQMLDQPQTPLERAVWWIEYVLRHGGAQHLRSPAANMSWAEYYELELVLIALTAFIIIFTVFSYSFVSLWRLVSRFASKNIKGKKS